jgi:hypothetical protein
MTPVRWLRVAAVVACGWLLPATASADAPSVKVIPPGNEKLIAEMLGDGAKLPGDCAFHGAALDRTFVAAKYACGGAAEVTVELRHPSDAPAGARHTKEFALVPKGEAPPALVEALEHQIAAREGEWRWLSAEAPGLGRVIPGAPTANTIPGATLSPEGSDQYLAGVKLYRAGKVKEALDAFTALARKNPHAGVLGMVVASLASTEPDPKAVARLAAEADAQPQDTLAQFTAGVAAHFYGHQRAKTAAEKSAMYEQTIKYLARTRPAFDFEPRLFVYLALSHFRLGHQAERRRSSSRPLASAPATRTSTSRAPRCSSASTRRRPRATSRPTSR